MTGRSCDGRGEPSLSRASIDTRYEPGIGGVPTMSRTLLVVARVSVAFTTSGAGTTAGVTIGGGVGSAVAPAIGRSGAVPDAGTPRPGSGVTAVQVARKVTALGRRPFHPRSNAAGAPRWRTPTADGRPKRTWRPCSEPNWRLLAMRATFSPHLPDEDQRFCMARRVGAPPHQRPDGTR